MTFKTVVNCTTGTVEQVELTPEELKEREARAIVAEQQRTDKQALDDKKADDAQAGRDALVALGLTGAQITALIGA
jgi:hypothetical protein